MTKTQEDLLAAGLLFASLAFAAFGYFSSEFGELSTSVMFALIIGANWFNLKRGKLDEVSPIWKRAIVISCFVGSIFAGLFLAYGLYKLAGDQ